MKLHLLRMRICVLPILLFCCVGSAFAQSDYRAEVFGGLGVSEYDTFFGRDYRGFNIGAGFGVRPFSSRHAWFVRGLGAEFEANATRARNTTQGYFTGNLVYHFPLFSSEPYLVLGAGASSAGGRSERAADVGLGAKIFVTPHYSVRPEIRIFAARYLGDFVRFSLSVGRHW